MKQDILTKLHAKKYSKYIHSAVQHGVPLEEIIVETEKYHGIRFTNLVRDYLKK